MTLIQAKEIIWTEIIAEIKANWGYLTIVLEEKISVRYFEEHFMVDKKNTINTTIWAKKFIDFIDSKMDQELEENEIKNRILYALEINKMIVKNDYRKATKEKLKQ